MTAPAKVPACGRIGCRDITREHRDHLEDGWGAGDRVIAEPKRTTAPGWVWRSPHGTVIGWSYVEAGQEVVAVLYDDGETRATPLDLLTRYHTWRRRSTPAPKPKLLPRLPRSHRITDPDVSEPTLFNEAS